MRKSALVFGLLILCNPFVALAASPPPEISGRITAEKPYGSASLSRFIFHVYDIDLWTDSKTWSPAAPFALSSTYDMSLTSQELVDSTLDEMIHIHPGDEILREKYRNYLTPALPGVAKGDRITVLSSDKAALFYHNGRLLRTVKDETFATHFFDIWLSEQSTEPSLRNHLLKLSQ